MTETGTVSPKVLRASRRTHGLLRIVQSFFQSVHALFKIVELCLFCTQLLFSFHFGGLLLLFISRHRFEFRLSLRQSPLVVLSGLLEKAQRYRGILPAASD